MKAVLTLVVASMLWAAGPAQAQKIDLATIRCKEFVDSSKETIGYILMWLEGYYSEADAPPVVDFDKMKVNGGKIGEYCGKYPGHSLITAADEVMGK
jgi:acid stress chaperone HdeB